MFCSLEKLKMVISASLLLGLFLTAHGEYFLGRINSKYLFSKGTIKAWRDCGNTICGKEAIDCNFAIESKECYQINLPFQLLLKWFREKIGIIEDEKMEIYIFYSDRADIMTEKPRVWWPYDDVSKGRNFGTAGSAMDIPVDSVVWAKDAKGPRAGSPLLYAEGRKREQVALTHNGQQLLDMLAKFTISMWVKTIKGSNWMPLLGSIPWRATRLEFWPRWDKDMLSLAFNNINYGCHYQTTIDKTGLESWRHVAVTYTNPGSDPIFFLNGNVWPLRKRPTPDKRKKQVKGTHITMWRTTYRSLKVACVMIFQATLSQSQIKALKDICP